MQSHLEVLGIFKRVSRTQEISLCQATTLSNDKELRKQRSTIVNNTYNS